MQLQVRFLILLLFCAITLPAQDDNIVTVKAYKCRSHGKIQEATYSTGFYTKIKNYEGIVTALHGVCGCDNRFSVFSKDKEFKDLKIIAVDIENDIAILSSGELTNQFKLLTHYTGNLNALKEKQVKIKGHPEGRKACITKYVMIPDEDYEVALENILSAPILVKMRERGSPSVTASVLHFDGTILGGHSGSPILFEQNDESKVVGVTTGYMNGDIGWGALIKNIKPLAFSGVASTELYKQLVLKNPSDVSELTSIRFTTAITPFPVHAKFNVLILPFQDSIKHQGKNLQLMQVEDSLFTFLNKSEGVEVRQVNEQEFMPSSFDEAMDLGKEFNADLVLYGNYLSGDTTQLNYVIVDTEKNFLRGSERNSNLISSVSFPEYGKIPNNIEFIIGWSLAMKAYSNYELEKSVTMLEKLSPETNKQRQEYFFKLGNIAHEMGRTREMIRNFEQVSALDPNDIRPYFVLGVYYGARNDFDSAELHYKKALTVTRNDFPDTYAKILYNLDILYWKNGQKNDVYFNMLKTVNTYHYELLTRIRIVNEYLKNNESEKVVDFFLQPENIHYADAFPDMLAGCYQEIGDTRNAKRLLVKAVRSKFSRFHAMINLTDMYLRENNLDSAEYFINILKPLGKNYMQNDWLIVLARYYYARGDQAAVTRTLNEITAMDPFAFSLLLIFYVFDINDFETAVSVFNQHPELVNKLTGKDREYALLTYAVATANLKLNPVETRNIFRTNYLKYYDTYSFRWLAMLYKEQPDSLRLFIHEGLRKKPSDAVLLLHQGHLLIQKGNWSTLDSARHSYWLARANVQPSEVNDRCEILYSLGYTWKGLQPDSVLYYWKQTVAIDPDGHRGIYNLLGDQYNSMEMYDSAEHYYLLFLAAEATHPKKDTPDIVGINIADPPATPRPVQEGSWTMLKLAKIYENALKSPDKAEKYLLKVMSEEKNWDAAKLQLAELYKKADNKNKSDLALKFFAEVYAQDKNCDTCLLGISDIYKKHGDIKKSKIYLDRAKKINTLKVIE